MISLRKATLLLTVAAFSFGLASCSKRNTELETDYATKKASAETLIGQINTSMNTMKSDHDQWMKSLADAAAKPGADTSKLGSLKSDLQKHMNDMNTIMALEDSVKAYMNATPDQGDAFKNADDRLGTNFNDLNDKWKAFQDAHTNLQKDIQQFAVNTAGNAMQKDTMKAKEEVAKPEKAPKKEAAKPAMKKEAATPASQEHQHHGAPRY